MIQSSKGWFKRVFTEQYNSSMKYFKIPLGIESHVAAMYMICRGRNSPESETTNVKLMFLYVGYSNLVQGIYVI